ncbi:MAG TPA: integrase core domain-containing protein, partial [Candidatus Dormibacteraeota bacterium]
MGIRDRPITPRSPWQNGHVERLIGSIRRECLDHVVVLGKGTSAICWRITPPITMGCARTLRSTRILHSSGESIANLNSSIRADINA